MLKHAVTIWVLQTIRKATAERKKGRKREGKEEKEKIKGE
jgi:hypothetical protein